MRTRFAKAYGIKVRCYGEHVEEHLGTHREHSGNTMGTKQKWEKKNSTMPAFTVLQGVLTLDQPYF